MKGKKQSNKLEVPSVANVRRGIPVHGLYGVMLLIVCASVIYANYRVFFGVEDLVARVMLIPSSLAVVTFLVYKSLK